MIFLSMQVIWNNHIVEVGIFIISNVYHFVVLKSLSSYFEICEQFVSTYVDDHDILSYGTRQTLVLLSNCTSVSSCYLGVIPDII